MKKIGSYKGYNLRAVITARNSQIRYMRKMICKLLGYIESHNILIPHDLLGWLEAERKKK